MSQIDPIFVTGFQRTGTTLMRRLVSMHPNICPDLLHEQRRLHRYQSAEDAIKNYKDEFAAVKSGEKIPYYSNLHFIKRYIKKWHEFWPNATIFHMIRGKKAVIDSNKRTFKLNPDEIEKNYDEGLQCIGDFIDETGIRFCHIIFEHLIADPMEIVTQMYRQITPGAEISSDYVKKVISTKEPWEYNGMRRAGLRYFDRVGGNA